MTKRKQITRWTVALGLALAFGGVASDGEAAAGHVTVWLNDITNTVGDYSFCEQVTSDTNGTGNGNAGKSTTTNDTNDDGNGNAGQGSRTVCLWGTKK